MEPLQLQSNDRCGCSFPSNAHCSVTYVLHAQELPSFSSTVMKKHGQRKYVSSDGSWWKLWLWFWFMSGLESKRTKNKFVCLKGSINKATQGPGQILLHCKARVSSTFIVPLLVALALFAVCIPSNLFLVFANYWDFEPGFHSYKKYPLTSLVVDWGKPWIWTHVKLRLLFWPVRSW